MNSGEMRLVVGCNGITVDQSGCADEDVGIADQTPLIAQICIDPRGAVCNCVRYRQHFTGAAKAFKSLPRF